MTSTMRKPFPFAALATLPATLSIPEAGRAGWGLSRAMAYELAQRGEFPCEVVSIGARFHVRTADMMRALGLDPDVMLATIRAEASAAGTSGGE